MFEYFFIHVFIGILKYSGVPAILSEEADTFGKSIQWIWEKELKKPTDFWVLGAAFNDTRITPNSRIACNKIPCYEKSLKVRKICKPGMI